MRDLVTALSLGALLLVATACEQGANRGDATHEAAVTPADSLHSPAGPAAVESDTGAHAAPGHAAAPSGGQALLPIMQTLGSQMTTLTHALMTDDYQAVEQSAGAIAAHAPISARELERLRTVLGPDMHRFEVVDESVHVASVRLHEAARSRQPGRIAERLGEVQRGCVSCHVQFRARLLTNRTGGDAAGVVPRP